MALTGDTIKILDQMPGQVPRWFQLKMDEVIRDLISAEVWDELDVFQFFGMNSSDNGLHDWKAMQPRTSQRDISRTRPTRASGKGGDSAKPVHIPWKGFQLDGVQNYLNSQFAIGRDEIEVATSDGFFGTYQLSNDMLPGLRAGYGAKVGDAHVAYIENNDTNGLTYGFRTNLVTVASPIRTGLILVGRIGGDDKLIHNGVEVDSTAAVVEAGDDLVPGLGSLIADGDQALNWGGVISLCVAGKFSTVDQLALYNGVQKLIDAADQLA